MSEIKAVDKLRELVADINAKEIVDHMQLYPNCVFDCKWLDSWHSEFNRLIESFEAEIAEYYMKRPVDADGVPWHIGEEVDGCEIVAMAGYQLYYYDDDSKTVEWCIARNRRHVKPRTLEDMMAEYEELAANQNVKDYFEVSKELRTIQSEQFRDEPELELYKEVNGCRFYIELPYDELWIMTDKVEVKHHSYSYRYERPDGSTVMSCSSLCGYPREWAIERLDEAIEEIRELLGGDAE